MIDQHAHYHHYSWINGDSLDDAGGDGRGDLNYINSEQI